MATEPYLAAVVQAPILGVTTNETAHATMRRNAAWMARTIDRLMLTTEPRPRLVVYPVHPLTSANRKDRGISLALVAQELPGDFYAPVLEMCARHDCYFAASVQESLPRFPGVYFHTGFVLGPQGLVLRAPKAQAYSAADITSLRDCYDAYVAIYGEAAVMPVAETPIGRLGCVIEQEALVPEVARLLTHKGAELLLHPSIEVQAGEQYLGQPQPYDALQRTMAFTNGVYVLSASPSRQLVEREDGTDELWYGGSSSIIGPDGRVEALIAGRCEGAALARIDFAHLHATRAAQARNTTPVNRLYRGVYAAD